MVRKDTASKCKTGRSIEVRRKVRRSRTRRGTSLRYMEMRCTERRFQGKEKQGNVILL